MLLQTGGAPWRRRRAKSALKFAQSEIGAVVGASRDVNGRDDVCRTRAGRAGCETSAQMEGRVRGRLHIHTVISHHQGINHRLRVGVRTLFSGRLIPVGGEQFVVL